MVSVMEYPPGSLFGHYRQRRQPVRITNTNLITLLAYDMIPGGQNTDSVIITNIHPMENTATNAVELSHGFISGLA